MKKLFAYSLLLLIVVPLLMWFFSDPTYEKEQAETNLPWKMEFPENGATRIFGQDVGQVNLRELMMSLHKVGEISVFQDKQDQLTLEAYFKTSKIGIFDAKLIAEVEATQEQLRPFIAFHNDKDSTPSGRWKYNIVNQEFVDQANAMRVWKLMYIPSANYEPVTIEKYFGKPDSKESISEKLYYWYYPEKGLVIQEDTESKEVFYYVAKKDYERLLGTLSKEPPEE